MEAMIGTPESGTTEQCAVGVIGGTGLYAMEALADTQEHRISTPFGEPSDALVIGRLAGVPVAFLARHGRHHQFLPSEVPYRANIWAMRSLGVRYLVSCSAVGSLRKAMAPRDMVIPHQFIDRTRGRATTFFGDGCVGHVGFGQPLCLALSDLLWRSAEACIPDGRTVHRGGTYICMEGPAFSTRAESELYRSWQADIIGMTNLTEAKLAMEAEIAYASLSMVTDYDCWNDDHESVNAEMIVGHLRANAAAAQAVVADLVEKLAADPPASAAHDALRYGLLTPADAVPVETRRRLDLFTSKYWGSFTG